MYHRTWYMYSNSYHIGIWMVGEHGNIQPSSLITAGEAVDRVLEAKGPRDPNRQHTNAKCVYGTSTVGAYCTVNSSESVS